MMKYSLSSIFCVILGLGIASPAFGQTEVLPNIPKYFAVGFEQNGQLIPIEEHQIILQKKPFSIIIYFKQPDSVLVNASFAPGSFEQARSGIPLQKIAGFSDLGMAEEPFNPKTLLMISAQAPHYWYYEHEANHRFNDIRIKNGMLICQRIVGQIMYRDTTRKMIALRDIREDVLYLVFMRTEWTKDFRQQHEKQREYVKVIFR